MLTRYICALSFSRYVIIIKFSFGGNYLLQTGSSSWKTYFVKCSILAAPPPILEWTRPCIVCLTVTSLADGIKLPETRKLKRCKLVNIEVFLLLVNELPSRENPEVWIQILLHQSMDSIEYLSIFETSAISDDIVSWYSCLERKKCTIIGYLPQDF